MRTQAGNERPRNGCCLRDSHLEYRGASQAARPFVPFYRVGKDTPYGMYFDVETRG